MSTYLSTKKIYFYTFFPTNVDEAEILAAKAKQDPNGPYKHPRTLIEIRDWYAPPVFNSQNPWQIRNKLTFIEAVSGELVLTFHDTFEYVFRYWSLRMATHVAVSGQRVAVDLWDVTDEKNPRKYSGDKVNLQMSPNDDYSLACIDMVVDRRLKMNDCVGLYWDQTDSAFKIKVLFRGFTL